MNIINNMVTVLYCQENTLEQVDLLAPPLGCLENIVLDNP